MPISLLSLLNEVDATSEEELRNRIKVALAAAAYLDQNSELVAPEGVTMGMAAFGLFVAKGTVDYEDVDEFFEFSRGILKQYVEEYGGEE